MKLYLRLIKFLGPYKGLIFIAILCTMAFALTNGLFAFMIGPVLKFLFAGESMEPIKFIPFDLMSVPKDKMMLVLPMALIVLALIKGASSFGQSYLMAFAGFRVINDLRSKLYRHILDLPLEYFANAPTGVLTSKLTHDVNMVRAMTTDTLSRVFKQAFTVIALAAVVIAMDWKLAVMAFIVVPLIAIPMVRFGKKMKKASKKGQMTMGTMTALLQEAILGIRIVKSFCMEDYEQKRFSVENEKYTVFQTRMLKVRTLASPLMEFFGAIGFAGTIYYASYRIAAGTLAPETFISFFAATMMLYQPIKALNGVSLNLQQGMAAVERVFELMDTHREDEMMQGTKEISSVTSSIEFKGVGFRYGKELVLESIDLKVKSGEVTAIVGMSGSGKTTLVNLIPRFYDTSEGVIEIDGTALSDLKLKSLREQVSMVSQQVILFNDTVKNNIAYGQPDTSETDIVRAAKAANAHGFISALEGGYDALIGEGGVRLSGGERQRISIARAILKNAPILVMDEATSALDTESEMEVQKGLNNLMQGRTAFVIAHRLSTVTGADRIVVLKDGHIVETGTHDELLKKSGEYMRLYSMQFYGGEERIAT